MKLALAAAVVSALAVAPAAVEVPEDVAQDFSKELAAPWKLSGKTWRVEDGELRGRGDGWIEYSGPLTSDFALAFDASTAEKANVEVKLYDAATKKELYTFAFMGKYHSALDGVKSCVLKGDRFVNVDAKTWIYPGRTFRFEVRRAKNQHQMFVNGVLGPFFVDEAPPPEDVKLELRILVSTEGKDDAVRLDDVKIVMRRT